VKWVGDCLFPSAQTVQIYVDLIEMESYMEQQVVWCRHVTRLFITLLVSNNTPFHMYSGRACEGWPRGGREHLKRLNIGCQDLT
jgi:hypothetical protein